VPRSQIKLILSAVWIMGSMFASLASAQSPSEMPVCASEVLELLHHDPHAVEIYRRVDNPKAFFKWIDCGRKSDLNLPVAIHETTHRLARVESGKISLFGLDRRTRIVPSQGLFPRGEIVADIPEAERDDMVDIYLAGGMGQTDLSGLLNELNAYTTETQAATNFHYRYSQRSEFAFRDGLARMMHFVAVYLNTAKRRFPENWAQLTNSANYVEIIKATWEQAEFALNNSCRFKNLGIYDGSILDTVYTDGVLDGLRSLPGRTFTPTYSATCFGLERKKRLAPTGPIKKSLFILQGELQLALKREGTQLFVNGIPCSREAIAASPITDVIRDTLNIFMGWKALAN
jgi:hypothetical protein